MIHFSEILTAICAVQCTIWSEFDYSVHIAILHVGEILERRSLLRDVFTCSMLTSIVTILVSIVVILRSNEPILEKCVHLQVQYSRVLSQYS